MSLQTKHTGEKKDEEEGGRSIISGSIRKDASFGQKVVEEEGEKNNVFGVPPPHSSRHVLIHRSKRRGGRIADLALGQVIYEAKCPNGVGESPFCLPKKRGGGDQGRGKRTRHNKNGSSDGGRKEGHAWSGGEDVDAKFLFLCSTSRHEPN